MKFTQLDLFSGIGGFHLGFEKAGFEIESYFSEIDKYAVDVYKYNFKNSKYVGSVTDVRGEDFPKINLITFGSPCQDFSLAGKRRGLQGNRSSLIGEAIRLISECRPDFFIWENVKGTFSSNDGSDFWAILKEFTNIGGYRLEWQLLNTKWFLPQNRERIYLVGCLGKGSGQQIFPIKENNRQVNAQEVIQLNQSKESQGKQPYQQNRIYSDIGIVPALMKNKLDLIIQSNTKKGYEIAKPGDAINLSNPNSKTRRGRVGKKQSQTLDTACNMAVYTDKIRRLTPIECERLQGFPDNWTKYGKELGEISDTQRYKMCGNAVTVNVVEAVAKKIKTMLN